MRGNTARLGCDIGGTFTDFVLIDGETGALSVEKVLTTPADPATGIFDGVGQLERATPGFLARAATVIHGTTLVINALIERKGSRTALLTTRGFRDVLEMRDELRYDVYDLQLEFAPPLVPRRLRYEIDERVGARGQVIEPLDEAALPALLQAIRAEGVGALAVVFLHAYANPDHERRVGAWFARHAPEIAVSLSSDVLPRIKEYQRTSTTVANAYVKPRVAAYIGHLEDGLRARAFPGDLYIMQSSGGVIEAVNAKAFPVRILESGPAGGVAASRWWGTLAEEPDLLCFDMGGTTAKLCAVVGGELLVTDEYEAARHQHFKKGSGIAINVPVLDLLEIGTGGGSIARIDRLGLMKVGPQSAGAVPGPACYGRGGTEPTVTDADVVLGILDPDHFLGGEMRLHRDAAVAAVAAGVGGPLGLAVEAAAGAIHDVANEDMAAAARLHLAERGQSAEGLTMVAYGGAGPVHAFGLAEKLGLRRILVPPAAGVMSALGMLVANVAVDRSRTMRRQLAAVDLAELAEALRELEADAGALLPQDQARPTRVRRTAEMRYAGQGYNVLVDLPLAADWPRFAVQDLRAAFEASYRRGFGRVYPDVAVELVNLTVALEQEPPEPWVPTLLAPADAPVETARRTSRLVHLPGREAAVCAVYDRYRLRPGHVVEGPALVEERETTVLVGPGARLEVDRYGILVMTLAAGDAR